MAGWRRGCPAWMPVMFIDGPANQLHPRMTAQFEKYLAVSPGVGASE